MITPARQLSRSFFERDPLVVARELIGARLVRVDEGVRLSGFINETEAYIGEEDRACHARAGLTPRTRVMYGPPGFAYVYFTYGMHWLLNFITEREGFPSAVLIRSIIPAEGMDVIAARRIGQPPALWTNGPGKLARAFGIDGSLHGMDVCVPGAPLFVEEAFSVPEAGVTKTPRVGLNNVPEPWKSLPWRFWAAEDTILSA